MAGSQQGGNAYERDEYKHDGQHGTVVKDEYDARWEGLWSKGLNPGELFDEGKASDVLKHWLGSEVGIASIKGKRAVVPGCGRGYDVAAFAQAGASTVVGLELAPTAVVDAQAWLAQQAGLTPQQLAGAVVRAADFFKFEDEQGPFDVGYDYTFLCALHPSMRANWAAGWARLLRPGGRLVTLVFPVGKDPSQGPPWGVTPDLYRDLLLKDFECEQLEAVAPGLSHTSREGREWLGVWRRRGGQ